MTDIGEDDINYRFKIGMLVKHSKLDLEPLLRPLGMMPDNNRVAGHQRITPNQQKLPGTYRESFWNWRRLVVGDRNFMAEVGRLLEKLEMHSALMLEIVDDGGSVSVTIALSGARNIGSCLSYADMGRLARIKASLDIEIFPDFRNFI